MDKFKAILKWLNDNWKVISSIVVSIIAGLCVLFGVTGCGSVVRATIRTPKDSTHNEITISTNNPVDIKTDVNPTITLKTNKD